MCLSDYKAGMMTYASCTEAKLRISLSQVSTSLENSAEDAETLAAPLGWTNMKGRGQRNRSPAEFEG